MKSHMEGMEQLNLPFPRKKYKDMERATCLSCGKGVYYAKTLCDDWSGYLHCTKCGDYSNKWIADNE